MSSPGQPGREGQPVRTAGACRKPRAASGLGRPGVLRAGARRGGADGRRGRGRQRSCCRRAAREASAHRPRRLERGLPFGCRGARAREGEALPFDAGALRAAPELVRDAEELIDLAGRRGTGEVTALDAGSFGRRRERPLRRRALRLRAELPLLRTDARSRAIVARSKHEQLHPERSDDVPRLSA